MKPYTIDDATDAYLAACATDDPEAMAATLAELDRIEALNRPPAPSLLAAALWYAEQGISVLPLKPGQKAPATRHGLKDASTDPARLRAWWAKWPEANIGLRTGVAFDIVDIDGAIGQKSRSDNWGHFAALTQRGKVVTPRPGGMHLYVTASGRGNKAGLRPGIDYRGVGGYVVAPPSRTEQGTYTWLTPLTLEAQAVAA